MTVKPMNKDLSARIAAPGVFLVERAGQHFYCDPHEALERGCHVVARKGQSYLFGIVTEEAGANASTVLVQHDLANANQLGCCEYAKADLARIVAVSTAF